MTDHVDGVSFMMRAVVRTEAWCDIKDVQELKRSLTEAIRHLSLKTRSGSYEVAEAIVMDIRPTWAALQQCCCEKHGPPTLPSRKPARTGSRPGAAKGRKRAR